MPNIKMNLMVITGLLMLVITSCTSGPQPIKLGAEPCAFCKMTISDNRFGAEIITKKGRISKFDDTHCVLGFMKANTINSNDIEDIYLVNFDEPHNFVNTKKAFLLKSDEFHSPMGGNLAVFDEKNKMETANTKIKNEGVVVTWDELVKENK
ncbi:MAG: nitrous oxide reductase accessory protein NosL [Ginsengibacter sp.]